MAPPWPRTGSCPLPIRREDLDSVTATRGGWSLATGSLARVSLYFRRGSYNALVDLTAFGSVPASGAVDLARSLDVRMHKAD